MAGATALWRLGFSNARCIFEGLALSARQRSAPQKTLAAKPGICLGIEDAKIELCRGTED
jgi:hypothetical protein